MHQILIGLFSKKICHQHTLQQFLIKRPSETQSALNRVSCKDSFHGSEAAGLLFCDA